MKNIAVIFAGGIGKRMNAQSRPKQFLELNGKPVIIYTLEIFDNHPLIDGIIVSCVDGWIPFLERTIRHFGITKVKGIVTGGNTGQASIYNGLCEAERLAGGDISDTLVLIHDGVRPLIKRADHHRQYRKRTTATATASPVSRPPRHLSYPTPTAPTPSRPEPTQ